MLFEVVYHVVDRNLTYDLKRSHCKDVQLDSRIMNQKLKRRDKLTTDESKDKD